MSTAPTTPQLARPGGARRAGEPATAPDHDATSTRRAGRARRLIAKTPPELGVLLLIAAALNLYGLGINGNANEYYSAAVRSMTQSWSGFFFGTFDPAGIMTVDKPPLALWVQALSARVFGFGTWSFLVPQALMGVAAAALVYDLTRRRFGRAAAFVAGFALATTPTAVAVFRHNNPDALLMLCSTLALWATVRAFESPQRTRWLVLAGVAVGLGFEAKMATALLVVPGIVAAWLYVRPLGLLRSVRQVLAFSGAAAGVGLAWPIAVWLTPAGSRPWISGTSDNSIWSLIFGYNGLGRVLGQSGGPGGGAGGGPGGGGGGGLFGGDAGPLRLLNEALGSQAGWLLGLAVGGGLAILVASRLRRADGRTGWLIATGGAFAVTAVAFSFASGIFHPYYVSALAPFIAALVGAGLATMVGRGALGRFGVPSSEAAEARRATNAAGRHAGQSGPSADASGTAATQERSASHGGPIAADGPDRAVAGVGVGAAAVPERLWSDDGSRTPQAWFGHDDGAGAVAATATAPTPAAIRAVPDHEPTRLVRIVGGAGLIAGAVTEGVVLADADQLGWLAPVLLVATIAAGAALVLLSSRRLRLAAVGAAAALLLVAPAVWSAQTLGHATQGTFPTGGPESAGGMGGPGGMRGGRGGRGGFGGPPGAGTTGGRFAPPTGFTPPSGGFTPPTGAMGTPPGGAPGTAPGTGGSATGSGATGSTSAAPGATGTTRRGMGGRGGMFSGDQTAVGDALAYAKANRGGTIVVSGQSGAAPAILSSDAQVAGIGGFSGSESEITMDWFAGRVASGDIRWVMTSGGGMGGRDSRVGSTTVMANVAKTCAAVASVDGLYDCQGRASALRSAG